MVSKRPQDAPVRETEIGINNFGNAFFGFDLGDKVDAEGVWKYRVTGKVSGGDNYTDYSEDLRGFIMPQITFEPDAQTSATLYGYFSALDQVHVGNGFLPYVGTVVDAPFGKLDRKAFMANRTLIMAVSISRWWATTSATNSTMAGRSARMPVTAISTSTRPGLSGRLGQCRCQRPADPRSDHQRLYADPLRL